MPETGWARSSAAASYRRHQAASPSPDRLCPPLALRLEPELLPDESLLQWPRVAGSVPWGTVAAGVDGQRE